MTTALATLTTKLAQRLEIGDGSGLMETLKATAFKGQVSDAQMTALLIVANQYGLNPWTKEIYAFPDKNNGIVPVVGVDGWARILNGHPQFDGMSFKQDAESCTCIIYRKDRQHPTEVTEFMSECKRANVGPWTSHPRRMLRHKATIQCARLAFGFGGIYDQDEAERIVDVPPAATGGAVIDNATGKVELGKREPYPDEKFKANVGEWETIIASGKRTPQQIVAMLETKAVLSETQIATLNGLPEVIAKKKAAPAQQAESDGNDKLAMPEDKFASEYPVWKKQVTDGKKPADIIATLSTKWTLTQEQHAMISELDGVQA